MNSDFELNGCLILSALLFGIGMVAVFGRRNAIVALIGIEFMLNAAAINFVAFWRYAHPSPDGVMFAIFAIVVAAAEAGVGLALVIALYRHRRSARIDDVPPVSE